MADLTGSHAQGTAEAASAISSVIQAWHPTGIPIHLPVLTAPYFSLILACWTVSSDEASTVLPIVLSRLAASDLVAVCLRGGQLCASDNCVMQ